VSLWISLCISLSQCVCVSQKGLGVDPGWEEISWEEALDTIAERLRELRQRNPRGLAMNTFDWPAATNFVRAFVSAFGGGEYGGAIPTPQSMFCGNGVHPISYMLNGSEDHQPDLSYCDYLLVLGGGFGTGTGTHAMHMATDLADARVKRGMKMVVVDPCRNSSGMRASEWVPILPGTDAAFCLGVANVLINDLGIFDEGFLCAYTNAPYLITPDGHYARDTDTSKPLVLSRSKETAVPFDSVEPEDIVLQGESEVGGGTVKTAFVLLREHLRSYTPEYVAGVTTVSARAIRRIAKGFGESARIGAMTVVDGVELPLRPACAIWYRGLGQHQHGLSNAWSAAMLNIIVGAVDVPGGSCHSGATVPEGLPKESSDGLILPGNPYLSMRKSLPPKEAQFDPDDPDLAGMFPVAHTSNVMGALSLKSPEVNRSNYKLEVWICSRNNPIKAGGDPEETAEMLKKIPFQVSFAQLHEETSEFADILLPDTHFLERLVPFAYNSYSSFAHAPAPSDTQWTFSIQQPVVRPMGESRHWVQVLWELARRVGFQDDFYSALNVTMGLGPEHRLNPGQQYSYEEFCDRWMRSLVGEKYDLEYFKEHGWAPSPVKREVKHRYPRVFHKGRIPMYLEHWLTGGESVKSVVEEMELSWGDTSDFTPLVSYKPCWASQQGGADCPLYLVSPKVGFLTLNTSTIKNPQLQDLAWSMGEIFNAGIHPTVAERLGISTGDLIEIETSNGKKTTIEARVTPDVHPQVISAPGNAAKVLSPDGKAVAGQGVHLNSFLSYRIERVDMLSGAFDACVKVRIKKVENRSGSKIARIFKKAFGLD